MEDVNKIIINYFGEFMDVSMALIGLLVVLVLISGLQTVQLVSLSNFIQTGAISGVYSAESQATSQHQSTSGGMVGGC